MSSFSSAVKDPGKSRSVSMHRFGYKDLLQVREIAWVGLRVSFGSVLPESTARMPAKIPKQTTPTTKTAKVKRISFVLVFFCSSGSDVAGSFWFGFDGPDGPSLS